MQTHPFETELRLFSGRALFYFCPLPQKATEVELRSVQLESRYLKTHVGSLKPPISDEVLGHTHDVFPYHSCNGYLDTQVSLRGLACFTGLSQPGTLRVLPNSMTTVTIDTSKNDDTSNLMVQIKLRDRDLNAKGSGTEEHRLVVLLDTAPEDPTVMGTGRAKWARDCAERVTGDWLRMDFRAANRKCGERGWVPIGTLVIAIDKSIRGYKSEGRATYALGVVGADAEGKTKITWNLPGKDGHVKVESNGSGWTHTIVYQGRRYEVRS